MRPFTAKSLSRVLILNAQVFHIGNIFSLIFNLGCAFAPNTGALIGFRFLSKRFPMSSQPTLRAGALAGLSGSAPIACGGGSVGDLFSERDRASAMSIYTLGPLLGPAIGPICGKILKYHHYSHGLIVAF